jgi:putative lipoprotein
MKQIAIGLLSVVVPMTCALNLLQRAAEESNGSSLAGSSWQLVKFTGGDDTVLRPDDKAKYTLAFAADGKVSVQIDCNRGRGTWKSTGRNQLEFGPLALTRAMCPPAPLNDRMAKTWQYVRSYVVKDGHLFLSLMADAGIYEFKPLNTEGQTSGQLKGEATYRERMALPPNAIFEATLEDVSRAGGRAEVIGSARIEQPSNPPIPFDIAYDPSRIEPRHSYTVRARILVDGKLLFTTDQHYPVLTGGHGDQVSLLLKRVSNPSLLGGSVTPPRVGTARLENTYWRLTQLADAAITAPSKQQAAHLVLYSQTHLVSGSGGCNRVTGSYQVNGDQLIFSHIAGTMMACITGMDTEKAFLQALGRVNKWKITGRRLDLQDANGRIIASLEAR